jgi:transposase
VPTKQHVVRLTSQERQQMGHLLTRSGAGAHEQRRARILLHADAATDGPRLTDREIAAAVGVTPRTVARVRSQFVRSGVAITLHRKPRTDRRVRKLDGAAEARLTALACSEPPPGQVRWTLRLLADQLVQLEVVESICRETVRTALKKTVSNPGW